MPEPAATSPERALELLSEGNRRWVQGSLAHPNRSVERRQEVTDGQAPFATVFSCIDSRVPAEIVFDCGIGDLVVVRSGGHVLDETAILGSLQFGVEYLHTPLLLVLGHQACGAVTTAIEAIEQGHDAPAGLRSIVDAIRPAHELVARQEANGVEETVRAHTRLTVQAVTRAPLIAPLVQSGRLRVVGGYYSLGTGAVSILE